MDKRTPPIDSAYGHLPPQNIEAERLVLGALMVDGDAFSVVSEILRPDTFYEPRHRHIFTAIQGLSLKEQPVDIVTVCEELRRMGKLEDSGGEMYVVELSGAVASSAHLEMHARILAQKHLARQLIHFAGTIEGKAFDETSDMDELMQEAEGKLFEISQKNLARDYTQIDPVIAEAVEILQRASANDGGLTGLPTGFRQIDDLTSGWQPGDLIIVAGRPAMGKTSFALSLAKCTAIDYRIPVGFFSLEMSNVQLGNRIMSNVCEVEGRKILSGNVDRSEWERIDRKIRDMQGAPLYVDDTPALSVFEFRTKARRMVREKGVKMIMIDYLQLMNAAGTKYSNRQEEVSTISRSLKSLAKELNIPIMALAQLNRDVANREGLEGKRPQLSDLRESGAIEQDADMVILVHRPEYYRLDKDEHGNDTKGKAQIIFAKHRKGATGDVTVKFQGEFTRFEDLGDSLPPAPGHMEGEIVGSRINTNEDYLYGADLDEESRLRQESMEREIAAEKELRRADADPLGGGPYGEGAPF